MASEGYPYIPMFFCWLGKSGIKLLQGFFQGTDSCARSHEAMGIQHVLHPLKFNMIHLRISPGRRRFRTWKPSFSGSTLISVGVKSKKECEPYVSICSSMAAIAHCSSLGLRRFVDIKLSHLLFAESAQSIQPRRLLLVQNSR